MFTPKGFLTYGGAILVLVGLLGMFGILIGPTPEQSIFGSAWWFDNAENWAHLVLGVVGIAAAFVFPVGLQRMLVLLLGIVGILVAVYNVFSTSLLGANLESPADLILHAVVGAWALYAYTRK
jgi:hypothetical protein